MSQDNLNPHPSPDHAPGLLAFRQSVSAFRYAHPASSPPRSLALKQQGDREAEGEGAVSPSDLPSPGKRKHIASQAEQKTGRSPKKPKRGYAPPETYAHLNMLSDYLAEDLDVMFCGINPGYTSAEIGHHYANPVNHFWKCLHRSGLTPSLVPPSEDFTLPEKFNLGMTNLVDRPSAEAAELSAADRISAVPALLAKIARYRPRIVCFVGKGIWLDVERVLKTTSVASVTDYAPSTPERSTVTASPGKRSRKASAPEFSYEKPQPYKVVYESREDSIVAETLFFVVPSTSGRVVSHQLNDKIVLFTALKHLLDRLKDGEVDTSHMAVVCLPGS